MSVTISGSGQIIKQVVVTTATAQVSTTSTTPVTTGLTANITPTNSANKILAVFSGTTLGNAEVYTWIYRNGSVISARTTGQTTWISAVNQVLDSPATTSSTTYTIYFAVNSGTGYVGRNDVGNAGGQTLTLYEVAYS